MSVIAMWSSLLEFQARNEETHMQLFLTQELAEQKHCNFRLTVASIHRISKSVGFCAWPETLPSWNAKVDLRESRPSADKKIADVHPNHELAISSNLLAQCFPAQH
jgi:hypothetical protein